jgi:hypothetical protein
LQADRFPPTTSQQVAASREMRIHHLELELHRLGGLNAELKALLRRCLTEARDGRALALMADIERALTLDNRSYREP